MKYSYVIKKNLLTAEWFQITTTNNPEWMIEQFYLTHRRNPNVVYYAYTNIHGNIINWYDFNNERIYFFTKIAQSAGAVEYTDCFSAEG